MPSTTGVSTPGQPLDGGTRLYPVVVQIRMTRNMHSRLQQLAADDELGLASVIRIGLNRYLAAVEKQRGREAA